MELKKSIQSAFIFKKVMNKIYNEIDENIKIYDIAQKIESYISLELPSQLNNGIAFPVGIGINHCVAHNTPTIYDKNIILKNGDIVKIDFGVHIDGHITDSAFTIPIGNVGKEKFSELIDISKKATMIGVNKSGIDVLLSEIGEDIEEYVLSKEIEINGKIIGLKTMKELCGHSIGVYKIHSGKAIPNCKLDFVYNERMKENEKYAIEPFITTGNGKCIYEKDNNHYMLSRNYEEKYRKSKKKDKVLYENIVKNYSTLAFTQKWIYEGLNNYPKINENMYNIFENSLKELCSENIVEEYLPIYDVEGSYVAQHEHNVWIMENRVLHLTKNDKY